MKQYKAFALGVLATLLASSLFWAGTAFATTGCFPDTNGHWAETFICWLKDNGIATGYADGTFGPDTNVTRAEMAVMLQRAANVPPSTGEIRINVGPNNWDYYGTPPADFTIWRYYMHTRFTSSSAGLNLFLMTPDFPSALYGRNLSVKGVKYCYSASADAYVAGFFVLYNNQTSDAGTSDVITLVSDSTQRTDEACRYYSFTPVELDDNGVLGLTVNGRWASSGAPAQLILGHVTFYFQPTDTPVVPPGGSE